MHECLLGGVFAARPASIFMLVLLLLPLLVLPPLLPPPLPLPLLTLLALVFPLLPTLRSATFISIGMSYAEGILYLPRGAGLLQVLQGRFQKY